jgi:hypothetical protein
VTDEPKAEPLFEQAPEERPPQGTWHCDQCQRLLKEPYCGHCDKPSANRVFFDF